MQLLNVKITNILSIESAELSFGDSGLVLVDGWNCDLDRANGAGKSAIFNAISFAIYDKLPRKITNSEIVRRGSKRGEIEVSLEVGPDLYTVKRKRPKGVEFIKNGSPIDITQKEWESIIRLSYEQFLVSIYSAQLTETRFLSCNDSGKKDFLLRLMDLEKINELKKISDQETKSIQQEITQLTLTSSKISTEISVWEKSLIDEITAESQITMKTEELAGLNEQIALVQSVSRPANPNKEYEQKIQDKLLDIRSAKERKATISREIARLSTNLGDFKPNSSCPTCGQKQETTESQILHHQQEQAKIAAQIRALQDQKEQYEKEIEKEPSILKMKQKIIENTEKLLNEYHEAQQLLQVIRPKAALLAQEINAISVKLEKNAQLINKIKELQEKMQKVEKETIDKQYEFDFYRTISSIYSPTGVPAYILDSIIDSFNENVSQYIELMWPTANYQLNTYKENSNGDVVAKFSECLMIDGVEVSIGSLSGGEMKALSLCVDFAIIDILQTNFAIRINPIILDEPFDGLDVVGKDIVLGLLENLAKDRQILVVDHGSEAKSLFSKTIFVKKQNGISRITQDM
jgi:DNA repair exonuclease SbcCD ATPase subunit